MAKINTQKYLELEGGFVVSRGGYLDGQKTPLPPGTTPEQAEATRLIAASLNQALTKRLGGNASKQVGAEIKTALS